MPRFSLFENVRGLTKTEALELASRLGTSLLAFDAGLAGISDARRDRWYWSTIPTPTAEVFDVEDWPSSATKDPAGAKVRPAVLRDAPACDTRELLNCLTTDEGVSDMNQLNRQLAEQFRRAAAAGLAAEPALDAEDMGRVRPANLCWTRCRNGMRQLRTLTTGEREAIMGFPAGWCDGQTSTVAAKQLGNAWHVPSIVMLLSGLEQTLRELIGSGQLGTAAKPLKVLSFFDGIGGGWCALHSLLVRWGLSNIHLHYIAIENDAACQRVLAQNFPTDIKTEDGSGAERCHYHLTQWTDIRDLQEDIRQGKHAKFLEGVFLRLGGFPCNNLSGNNRAQGANGRTGLAGPHTGLFYKMEDILATLDGQARASAAD